MNQHDELQGSFDDIYHPKSNSHRRGRKAKPPPNGKVKSHIIRRPDEKPNVPGRLPVEVLEVIFSQLTQSNLRKGTSLVCKEWHRVTEQFISRKGTWKVSGMDYQDDLLERIRVGSVNTLECWFMLDPDVPGVQSRLVLPEHHAPMWDDFVKKITSPLMDEDIRSCPGILSRLSKAANTGNTMPPCLLHLIREIHFYGYDLSHPQHGIVSLISNLVAIHTLSIHDRDARYTSFPLTEILRHCPRLERLSIRGSQNSQVFIDLLPSQARLVAAGNSTKLIPMEQSEKKQPYRLVELTLRHVSIPVWILQRLLGECPRLQVLIAEDMNGGDSGALDTPFYREPLSLKDLYASAAKLCPQLKRLHLSHSTDPPVNVDLLVAENKEAETLLRSSFPKIREIAYISDQGALGSIFSNLVYLEILTERVWHDFSNIHQELFDSALKKMPHLLHLHALTVPYRVPNVMPTKYTRTEPRPIVGVKLPVVHKHRKKKFLRDCDPIHKNPAVITTTEPDLPPWIPPANKWACTRLQTLSLTPHGQSNHIEFFYRQILSSFVHLTELTLSQPSLLMGQLLSPSEDAHRFGKSSTKDRWIPLQSPPPPSSLEDYHATVLKAFKQRMAETKAGKRAENFLWALLPLRVLESLTLTVDTIPGVLFAQDFEFLRRTPPHLWSKLKVHVEYDEEMSFRCHQAWYEDEIDRPPEVVFWPKLGSFRVLYRDSPAQGFLYEPLLAQVEHEIRPAVDFRFQRVFNPRPRMP
ncbi:hypothetical protein BGZ92_008807 [Podila epicladia]|nr:hypothetical protein BGZ92_008807 [Podila epicladia]